MPGVTGNLMSDKEFVPRPPAKVPNVELLERVQFLAEASEVAGQDPDLLGLSQYLGSECDLTAKKSMIRTKPNYIFCRKCKTPLTPPHLADVVVKRNHVLYRCKQCFETHKIYKKPKKAKPTVKHWRYLQEVNGRKLVTIEQPSPPQRKD